MQTSKADVTVEFDHHCPISQRDPDDAYAELRESCPVAWTESHGGFWIVTRYQDVHRILREYKNFSSRSGMAIPAHRGVDIGIPVQLDPPEHSRYRRAMNPFMTKDAVEALLPRIRHWTTRYIDRVIERGECDLAYDLAVPIPGAITLEWVGWDAEDEWDRISEAWHDLLSYPLEHPRTIRSHENLAWFSQRIAEELDKRREQPRDDILTYVAQLEIEGEPISDARAVSMVTVWVAGGVDTTTTFMLAGLLHLLRNPEHRKRLADEPDLWETAMDEILRRYPPTRTTTRTVVNEVEVGGVVMQPGDLILVSLSGANDDPGQFRDPLEIDLQRTPNKHVAFGMGPHRCVGMHLARQEFRVVVGEILRRLPELEVRDGAIAAYERQSEMRGWTSVPITFTPGERSDAGDIAGPPAVAV
jgi:cytochrome P450